MREQVVTPRAGRSAADKGRSGAPAQRPARRKGSAAGGSSSGSSAGGLTLSKALGYVPLAAKILLAIGVGLAMFTCYRAVVSASFFQAQLIDVGGDSRASEDEIRALVRRAVVPTGVWRADLSRISAELERQPWVRTAIVSRVLPSGIRVRITERTPRAVARTSAGRFVWVDEDAVVLNTVSPADQMPAFFIRGLDESNTNAARAENRQRIEKYLEMAREWEKDGLAGRVSEVNLDDLRDVRAQLANDDSQIEVRLGKDEFGKRLSRALKVLDDVKRSPRGLVTRLDATQDKRVIVGFSSGAQSAGERAGQESDRGSVAVKGESDAAPREGERNEPARRQREEAQGARSGAGRKNGEKQNRRKPSRDARASDIAPAQQTRPRRVG